MVIKSFLKYRVRSRRVNQLRTCYLVEREDEGCLHIIENGITPRVPIFLLLFIYLFILLFSNSNNISRILYGISQRYQFYIVLICTET